MKYILKDLLLLAAVLLGILGSLNLVNSPYWIYIFIGFIYFVLRYFDKQIELN